MADEPARKVARWGDKINKDKNSLGNCLQLPGNNLPCKTELVDQVVGKWNCRRGWHARRGYERPR